MFFELFGLVCSVEDGNLFFYLVVFWALGVGYPLCLSISETFVASAMMGVVALLGPSVSSVFLFVKRVVVLLVGRVLLGVLSLSCDLSFLRRGFVSHGFLEYWVCSRFSNAGCGHGSPFWSTILEDFMDISDIIFWGSHKVLAKVSSSGLPMEVVLFLFEEETGLAGEDVSCGSGVANPLCFSGALTAVSEATFEVEIWEVGDLVLVPKAIVQFLERDVRSCLFHFFTLSFLLFSQRGRLRGLVPLVLFELPSLWAVMNVYLF